MRNIFWQLRSWTCWKPKMSACTKPIGKWCVTSTFVLIFWAPRGQGVGHKIWTIYLFRNLNKSLRSIVGHKAADKDEIKRRTIQTGDMSYTIKFDEGGFKASTIFMSFHYHARFPMSSQSIIVGFFMLWVKWCIIPSLPKKAIAINVVYLVVSLAYGRPFRLLSAIVQPSKWTIGTLCGFFEN